MPVRRRNRASAWVVDAQLAAQELGIRPQNAYPLLRDLTEQGLLSAKAEYRAGTFWRSDEILMAIDGFAARAGRLSARVIVPLVVYKSSDELVINLPPKSPQSPAKRMKTRQRSHFVLPI